MKNFSVNSISTSTLSNGSAVVVASMQMCAMMMSMRMQWLDTHVFYVLK